MHHEEFDRLKAAGELAEIVIIRKGEGAMGLSVREYYAWGEDKIVLYEWAMGGAGFSVFERTSYNCGAGELISK